MEETKMKCKQICELKDRLVTCLSEQFNGDMRNVNSNEAGQVTDMIKDLCEAEEKLWKGCYYKSIVKAMHEEEERMERMPYDDRMGYDHYRYPSGRFAPKGHGTYSAGYRPMDDDWAESMRMEPWMSYRDGRGGDGMMGYRDGRGGDGMSSYRDGRGGDSQNRSSSDRYGYTPTMRGMKYDNYNKARMGYHETKDAHDKEKMDSSAREYIVDTAESIREMWKDADPNLRKEIKTRLSSLAGEMN